MRLQLFFRLLKSAATAWSNDNASAYGAAIAYYTVFSLAPVLLIAIAIASTIFGDTARSGISEEISQTFGAAIADSVASLLDSAFRSGGSTGITLFGLAILLFGASGVFIQLQDTLNLIWKADAPPPSGNVIVHFIKNRLVSFAAVLGTGFLLLASLVANAVLTGLASWGASFPGSGIVSQVIATVVSFGLITLLFAMIFKWLPDVAMAWADVGWGELLTGALFTGGQQLISLYLGQASLGSAYGAAGSLVVLLVWVYYSAQIVLFGAEFTHAHAVHRGTYSNDAATQLKSKQGINAV